MFRFLVVDALALLAAGIRGDVLMAEDLRAAERPELVPHHRSRIAGDDVRDGAFPIQLDGALRGAGAAVRQLPAVAARPIFVAVEINHRSPSQISAQASS